MLTQNQLKELVLYDENTGIFTRKYPVNNRKAGSICGWTKKTGYVEMTLNKKTYGAHRLAWLYVYGYFPKNEIDHIDGNPSNNRISNLRDVPHKTNSENLVKSRIDNKLNVLGVCYHKASKMFMSQIQVNKEKIHLGLFNTIEEAKLAYIEAKRKYHEGCIL